MQNVIPNFRIKQRTGRVVNQQHEVADFITDIFRRPAHHPEKETGMTKAMWAALMTAAMASTGLAQDFVGPASVGSSEQLYPYDDQEKWKHGYLKEMPYYHGHHSFRPYNYHHVYSQSQTAGGWGMNPNAPQSQQFWHKYESMASPGSPMISQRERDAYEQYVVHQQLQQQAHQQIQIQNQFNGGSYLSGFGGQQQAYGGAVGQPLMTHAVAPAAYQGTVPSPPQGPLFSQPNLTPQNSNSSLSDVQRQELRGYLSNPNSQRR